MRQLTRRPVMDNQLERVSRPFYHKEQLRRNIEGFGKRFFFADLETELGSRLEDHCGETLTFTLKRLGEVYERTFLKVKSFQGLKSYLKKTYEIDLEIT